MIKLDLLFAFIALIPNEIEKTLRTNKIYEMR